MALAWNPGAIPGLIALLTGTSMAALVYWTRPARSQNRRLALLLALEGLGFGALGGLFLATNKATGAGLVSLDVIVVLTRPWVYLAFLATLDSPLVDRLDNRWATGAFSLGAVASVASYFAFRGLYVDRVVPVEMLYQGSMPEVVRHYTWLDGSLGDLPFFGLLAVALFGLVVAFSVYRHTAEGSARRSSARAYLAAFGVRDAFTGLAAIYIVSAPTYLVAPPLIDTAMAIWLPQVGSVLFSLLLAYGILKTQLFEIDLKIKWTVEKSTVAATFVAVFFVVSEGAQVLFAGFAGSEILGVLAAGALVFFLAPLQRFADRVGDAAMPEVEDTEAYREQRKRELYRAAVESAMEDEEITDKERDVLARMADELELTSQETLELEREVLGAIGGEA